MKTTPTYSIFGAGFIGCALGAELANRGVPYRLISRGGWPAEGSHLGRVIFTSGMTSGFRDDPFGTAEAHVTYLSAALRNFTCDSFVYLSSTRLYIRAEAAVEDQAICVDVNDPEDIFTATKLTAELLVLSRRDPCFRVARLSNVYGPNDRSNNFLTSLINDRREGRPVVIRNSRNSSKDYIHINDVVSNLLSLADAPTSRHSLYNIAGGRNISNLDIWNVFLNHGTRVEFENEQKKIIFPVISVSRFNEEFCASERVDFSSGLGALLEEI